MGTLGQPFSMLGATEGLALAQLCRALCVCIIQDIDAQDAFHSAAVKKLLLSDTYSAQLGSQLGSQPGSQSAQAAKTRQASVEYHEASKEMERRHERAQHTAFSLYQEKGEIVRRVQAFFPCSREDHKHKIHMACTDAAKVYREHRCQRAPDTNALADALAKRMWQVMHAAIAGLAIVAQRGSKSDAPI